MFKWLKYLFGSKKNESEKVVVHFKLPNGKNLDIEAIKPLEYLPTESKCKKHWEYTGISAPTNNCNDCWEYYSKKVNHKW